MTTVADWHVIIPELEDPRSVALTRRIVEAQRTWHESQAAQLQEVSRLLEEQAGKLGE